MKLFLKKLYVKIIKRNFWMYIAFIGAFILSALSYKAIIDIDIPSAGDWIQSSTYPLIYGLICFMMMGIQLSRDNSELMNTNNIRYKKYILRKMLKLTFFALILTLIPIGIVTYHFIVYGGMSTKLLVNFLIEIFSIWTLSFIVSGTTGFAIGTFVENNLAYVCGIIMLYLFSPYFSNIFSDKNYLPSKALSVLNLCVYDINLGYEEITSFVFDNLFILDKVFSINLILILISACIIRKNHKNKSRNKISIILMSILILVNSLIMIEAHNLDDYKILEDECISENLNDLCINDEKLAIKSYEMNMDLSNGIRNMCNIEVENSGENAIKKICFQLDNKFKLLDIKQLGTSLEYNVDNGLIEIDLDKTLDKNQHTTLSIEYTGNFAYKDSVGYDIFFANREATFFDDSISWYPRLKSNDDTSVYYSLNIDSNNYVICNLNLSNVDEKENESKFHYEGSCNKLFLLKGFINSIENNDVTICGPTEMIKNNKINYDNMASEVKSRNYSKVVFAPRSPAWGKRVPNENYGEYLLLDEFSISGYAKENMSME